MSYLEVYTHSPTPSNYTITIQGAQKPDVDIPAAILSGSIPGSSQSNPILPNTTTTILPPGGASNPRFNELVRQAMEFRAARSGWADPIAAYGFDYVMDGSSLFTSIDDFPTGFSNPFTVSTGGVVLGTFNPGQTVFFANGGVSSFTISGINPVADASVSTAFPLKLSYSTPTADFTMTSINQTAAAPEPASCALFSTALLPLAGFALRRRRNRTQK